MTKKKFEVQKNLEIASAKQALEISQRLDGVWSFESRLSQRTLIYIARLLEEQNSLIYQIALDSKKSSQRCSHWMIRVVAWLKNLVGLRS